MLLGKERVKRMDWNAKTIDLSDWYDEMCWVFREKDSHYLIIISMKIAFWILRMLGFLVISFETTPPRRN
jgi:hypothetical protein